MFIIYDLIFLLISLFFLPVYLFKGKFHAGFSARLGVLPQDMKFNRPIWIHAVSVGEVMAVRKLAEELKKDFPQKQIIISTVTATGNKVARDSFSGGIFITYLPLDFSFIIKRVFNKVRPRLFILAETEIWPNLITFLHQQKVPIIVVNGRISDRSYRGYRFLNLFSRHIFNKVALFCVQSERDAQRLKSIGVDSEKVAITGNMKFDALELSAAKADYTELRHKLCLGQDSKLLVAGSTHPGEEEIIFEVYGELHKAYPNLSLLIAPRHPERSGRVAKLADTYGFHSIFISALTGQCTGCRANVIYILDSVGKLAGFYSIADFVFVGGSLVKKGGHNIIEPALYAKPILIGPHMFNFRDIASLFLEHKAAILVRNIDELALSLNALLEDPSQADVLGKRAYSLLEANSGATAKNRERIEAYED